jgi:hypothetical protein
MSRLETTRGAFADCFCSGRLWLIQFLANPILLALFVVWLLIPVASSLHLVFNFLFALVLLVAGLTLHAGTLNYFIDGQGSISAPLWPAFRRTLRHLLPVAICVAVACLLWLVANKLEAYQSTFPNYVRSILSVSLRRHITVHALDNLFAVVVFTARWILAPGLLSPLLLQAADRGFSGFGKQGFSAWRKTVWNVTYWLVLAFAALLGVFVTGKLMAWAPDFKTSTFHSEAISLTLRLFVSYLFGLFSWMLTCSLLGRCAAATGSSLDLPRNSAA